MLKSIVGGDLRASDKTEPGLDNIWVAELSTPPFLEIPLGSAHKQNLEQQIAFRR